MRVSSNQMEFAKVVGNNVRRVRQLRALTLTAVADKIGMKRGALCNIELGHVSPYLTTLKQIADALDVDIKVFL